MLGALLDTVLDRSIVGGYSNIGYRLRQHRWQDAEPESMTGRVVLVTGATSALGSAAAAGFARLGATVHLLARDRSRGEDARAAVAEQAEGDVHLGLYDLADLADVRQFAQRFAATVPRLDVLVNNAGVLTPERTLSVDGIELTFAVNVLAPFLLTAALLEPLRRATPSRIINVSSGGMYAQRLNADDLQNEQDFNGTTAYARTKRAEVVLSEMWADRLAPDGIVVNSMHPGWADTAGVRSSLPRFYRFTKPLLRTPGEGADTIVWLGAAPEAEQPSGGFWHDRVKRPTHLLPTTRESAASRRHLWGGMRASVGDRPDRHVIGRPGEERECGGSSSLSSCR